LSQNPVTTFDLVDSNSMDGVGSLANATGRSFKPVFNGPGTFSFTLRLDDKVAYQIATRATGVLITRNSSQIWSGGVTNVVRSAASNTMQVTATGWLEELDHRFVRKTRRPRWSSSTSPAARSWPLSSTPATPSRTRRW
jgi:hypothetical protein